MFAKHIRKQYSLVCLPCLQALVGQIPGTRPRQAAWVRREGRSGLPRRSRPVEGSQEAVHFGGKMLDLYDLWYPAMIPGCGVSS